MIQTKPSEVMQWSWTSFTCEFAPTSAEAAEDARAWLPCLFCFGSDAAARSAPVTGAGFPVCSVLCGASCGTSFTFVCFPFVTCVRSVLVACRSWTALQ